MASTSILPKRLQPMLATLTDGPFDDNDWIFEDKYGMAALMGVIRVAPTASKASPNVRYA